MEADPVVVSTRCAHDACPCDVPLPTPGRRRRTWRADDLRSSSLSSSEGDWAPWIGAVAANA